jgi:hypothetical protein
MYGLMGSLLLEWMLVSVRRVCNQLMLNTRQVIRAHEMADESYNAGIDHSTHPPATVSPDQFLSVIQELQTNQHMLTQMVDKHQEKELIWLQTQEEYINAAANRKMQDRNTQDLLLLNLKVNQETLQSQEANKQHMLDVQVAYQQHTLQLQEATQQQFLQMQQAFQQQVVQVQAQVQEAYAQQMKEFSDQLNKQFEQISVHTQQLNLQVTELNKIYRHALGKPHVLMHIWVQIKRGFSACHEFIDKKKR